MTLWYSLDHQEGTEGKARWNVINLARGQSMNKYLAPSPINLPVGPENE